MNEVERIMRALEEKVMALNLPPRMRYRILTAALDVVEEYIIEGELPFDEFELLDSPEK